MVPSYQHYKSKKQYKRAKRTTRIMRRAVPRIPRWNLRTAGFAGKESKYIDYSHSVDIPTGRIDASDLDPATYLCLNAVSQGTGNQQRMGLRSTCTSISIQGHVTFPVANPVGSTTGYAKLWLLIDTQTNGAQATGEEFLTGPATNQVISHRNLENSHRFKTLKQITVCANSPSAYWDGVDQAGPEIVVPFEIHHKFKKPLQTRYLSTGDTVADVADNSIHLFGLSPQTNGNNSSAGIVFMSRCRFYAD